VLLNIGDFFYLIFVYVSLCYVVAGQTQRCLYIFAGERIRDHLNDIWLYHVNTTEVQHITNAYCKDSLQGAYILY